MGFNQSTVERHWWVNMGFIKSTEKIHCWISVRIIILVNIKRHWWDRGSREKNDPSSFKLTQEFVLFVKNLPHSWVFSSTDFSSINYPGVEFFRSFRSVCSLANIFLSVLSPRNQKLIIEDSNFKKQYTTRVQKFKTKN